MGGGRTSAPSSSLFPVYNGTEKNVSMVLDKRYTEYTFVSRQKLRGGIIRGPVSLSFFLD